MPPPFILPIFRPILNGGRALLCPPCFAWVCCFCLLFLLVAAGQNGGSKPPPYIKSRNFRHILMGADHVRRSQHYPNTPNISFADVALFGMGLNFVMPSLLCVGMLFLFVVFACGCGSKRRELCRRSRIRPRPTHPCLHKIVLTRKSFDHANNYELCIMNYELNQPPFYYQAF